MYPLLPGVILANFLFKKAYNISKYNKLQMKTNSKFNIFLRVKFLKRKYQKYINIEIGDQSHGFKCTRTLH